MTEMKANINKSSDRLKKLKVPGTEEEGGAVAVATTSGGSSGGSTRMYFLYLSLQLQPKGSEKRINMAIDLTIEELQKVMV